MEYKVISVHGANLRRPVHLAIFSNGRGGVSQASPILRTQVYMALLVSYRSGVSTSVYLQGPE